MNQSIAGCDENSPSLMGFSSNMGLSTSNPPPGGCEQSCNGLPPASTSIRMSQISRVLDPAASNAEDQEVFVERHLMFGSSVQAMCSSTDHHRDPGGGQRHGNRGSYGWQGCGQ